MNTDKKHKGKNLKRTMLSIIILLAITTSVTMGRYLYKSGGSFSGAVLNMVKDVLGEEEPVFILILGVSNDISVSLTDTIMLAGYNPDNNQAILLSIPRDTFVGKSEKTVSGYDKINALYQKSPEKTMEMVEKLTGINIDYYITVNTKALAEIVDSIGGVEFNVPINMNYDDPSQNLHIHLKAGNQVLNGKQAEHLVRFRHNNNGTTYSYEYGDNDEGRMRTQREFLKVAAKQVISWKNVDKIEQIAKSVFTNLETDMPLSKIIGYIPYAIDMDIDNISMGQLPGTSAKINDLWFFKANTADSKELINSYIDKLELTEEDKVKFVIGYSSSKNETTQNINKTTNNSINKSTSKTRNY